jgi:hypothetical protein
MEVSEKSLFLFRRVSRLGDSGGEGKMSEEGEGRVSEEENGVVKERSRRRVLRQRLCEEMNEKELNG